MMRKRTIGLVGISAAAVLAVATVLAQPDRGPRPRRRGGGAPVAAEPIPRTDAEKKTLAVLDDIHRNQRRGMMNVSKADGRLLRLLAETTGAKHVVEVGTSNGYSGTWIALGLRTTGGKLTTHEIDARRAALARKNFQRAGVDKIVTLVEGDAHKLLGKLKGPIDIVFLDADKEGYIDYLNKLLPLVRPGGLILAHNARSHGGSMKEFFQAVTGKAELETLFLHMQGAGISVTLKKR